MNKFDKERQDANIELSSILAKLVLKFPTQRFGQILRNYGFVVHGPEHKGMVTWGNGFNTEPQEVLARVKEAIKDIDL